MIKGIECAFAGSCGREPTRRTSERTGREWCNFSVAVGKDDDTQWVDVACFGPNVDSACTLKPGDRVYIEGKLSLRTWQNNDGSTRTVLNVAANLVQSLGKIGEQKPKKPRAQKSKEEKPDINAPLPFDDELPF
jgi:single-strand DNA-binding protein